MPKRGSGKRWNVISFHYRSDMFNSLEVARKKFGEDNVDYGDMDQIHNLKIFAKNKAEYQKTRTFEKKLKKQYQLW